MVYRTYASSEERDLVFLPLQSSWFVINHREGENDGLVSVTSQKWCHALIASDGTQKEVKQLRFSTPADHLNEVGWWDLEETNPVLGSLNIGKQKKEYEQKIKDIYLQIANRL